MLLNIDSVVSVRLLLAESLRFVVGFLPTKHLMNAPRHMEGRGGKIKSVSHFVLQRMAFLELGMSIRVNRPCLYRVNVQIVSTFVNLNPTRIINVSTFANSNPINLLFVLGRSTRI